MIRPKLLSHKIILLVCGLFFLLGKERLSAQTILRGKVTDASNGDVLMNALITVDNTTDSTLTNFDGEFELSTTHAWPLTLKINYYTYSPASINIANDKFIHAELQLEAVLPEFKIEGKGPIKEDSPQARVSMGIPEIANRAAPDLYTEVGTRKEIDNITASLGFQVLNTRGFNSTSPVRMLQIIDGVDNQSPGLNFSLGNFLGTSELDILRLEVISGASGPFYGPNAFNGVISQETKDPFIHTGLEMMARAGERNLFEVAMRYAQVFKNKHGDAAFAYKLNLYGLTARDWIADNTDPITDSRVPADNPGRYDAVNIYGDEYSYLMNQRDTFFYKGLGNFYRTGYHERDIVDYNTKNLKGNISFQWRMKPNSGLYSPEIILSTSLGSGTTIYQGDNRFSLRDILFIQPKIEFRQRNHYFIRAYYTTEDAGKSYDPYFTALKLQYFSKSDSAWASDYHFYWLNNVVHNNEPPYRQDSLTLWHTEAEAYSNLKTKHNPPGSTDFFIPGTARFDTAFAGITSRYNNESGGTRFYDRSSLFHVHGEYLFRPKFLNEIRIGGNFRQYLPDSKGTIFHDTLGTTIRNHEFGLYTGIRKGLLKDQKLIVSATFRLDKNQNFKAVNTYATSLVYKANNYTYLRASYSTALRNPTLSDQYQYLNVGPAIIAGHIDPVDSLITVKSFFKAIGGQDMMLLQYFNLDHLRPEYVRTYEIGLRTKLWKSIYVDANYYRNSYKDFLGYIIGIKSDFTGQPNFLIPENTQVFRYPTNSVSQVKTQGFGISLDYEIDPNLSINGNYSFNELTKTNENDPIIPAYNTPKNKFNFGLTLQNFSIGKSGFFQKTGCSINYKWVEGYRFEGSPQFTGDIPSSGTVNAQINIRYDQLGTTFKVGASNVFNNKHYETYGGPSIGRMGYVQINKSF